MSAESGLLYWVTRLLFALAVLIPTGFALYRFSRKNDKHSLWVGLITAFLVAGLWLVISQREARRKAEVETVKKELEAFQTAPADRRINAQTHEMMVDRLRGVPGPSVFVLANAPDQETSLFAREIVAVFKDAGWEVPESFGMIFTPILLPGHEGIPPGIVLGASPEVPPNIVNEVYDTFRGAGVMISMGPHWPGTEHPMSILVGPNRNR